MKYLLLISLLFLAGCKSGLVEYSTTCGDNFTLTSYYELPTREECLQAEAINKVEIECYHQEIDCKYSCVDNTEISVKDCFDRCDVKEDKCLGNNPSLTN